MTKTFYFSFLYFWNLFILLHYRALSGRVVNTSCIIAHPGHPQVNDAICMRPFYLLFFYPSYSYPQTILFIYSSAVCLVLQLTFLTMKLCASPDPEKTLLLPLQQSLLQSSLLLHLTERKEVCHTRLPFLHPLLLLFHNGLPLIQLDPPLYTPLLHLHQV